VGERWSLDADGMLPIPSTPGLGLTLDREAVARYTRGAALLDS
jgi:L-alanine-DL-glutamate epimerase-like enolase superfamily enzyme